MTIKDLRTLRSKLPVGAIIEIAAELNVSNTLVSLTLSGCRKNPKIIKLAIKKAKTYQKLLKKQSEIINQL
jgi:ribosomal protein L24